MQNKIAVVSLSGGMDSSSLLAGILASKQYKEVYCFAFDYAQRHRHELDAVLNLVTFLREKDHPVQLQFINLRDVFSTSQSALRNADKEVPKSKYNDANIAQTVVENRNVIFSSIVYGKALSLSTNFDADVDIFLGVHAQDYATYPDCRPKSIDMAKELFRISNLGSERIDYKAPFLFSDKTAVLASGMQALEAIGIDWAEYYSKTSSCYDPDSLGNACGECATCKDRMEAFAAQSKVDPIPYKHHEPNSDMKNI